MIPDFSSNEPPDKASKIRSVNGHSVGKIEYWPDKLLGHHAIMFGQVLIHCLQKKLGYSKKIQFRKLTKV